LSSHSPDSGSSDSGAPPRSAQGGGGGQQRHGRRRGRHKRWRERSDEGGNRDGRAPAQDGRGPAPGARPNAGPALALDAAAVLGLAQAALPLADRAQPQQSDLAFGTGLGLPEERLAPPSLPRAQPAPAEPEARAADTHAAQRSHAPQGGAQRAAHHGQQSGGRAQHQHNQQQQQQNHQQPQRRAQQGEPQERRERPPAQEVEGMLILEKAFHGHLRQLRNQYAQRPDDVHVPPRLVQRLALRDGSILRGPVGRGQGPHRLELLEVTTVDGKTPNEVRNAPVFKKLTSIDPDFHYAVGDASGDVSLRVIDLVCPVGRGQRGLIVAPPRSGKTVLLQKFAKAIEEHYPDVHLLVLLVDERPEEATEWRRTVKRGEVYVSTNDESARNHVELAEVVEARARRLVELSQDVFVVIDSITRLARATNSLMGGDGRTMSGGIDTRTMEKPKQFFGAARNTETAGSLTILGTTLVETGSRMDQVIFEEFKGTGNMELVLSRKLADRRIFPAIDIQKSGTRKEEKLISSRRLKLITTLRRVLNRMNFIEAMELLVTKLEDVKTNDEFLARFEIDPEA
jgi:transcription termination factor Rho